MTANTAKLLAQKARLQLKDKYIQSIRKQIEDAAMRGRFAICNVFETAMEIENLPFLDKEEADEVLNAFKKLGYSTGRISISWYGEEPS